MKATALYDLRLSLADFWRLTFRELKVMMRHRKADLDRRQMLVSVATAIDANYSACHPKDPVPLDWLMPKPPKADQEIAEELAMKLRMFVQSQARPGR